MISADRFRALCLALEGTTAAPHFDRTAFRARKIFATLPPDGRSANLLLVPELQAAIVESLPHAFTPVPGGWGRMGYTTVDLSRVTEAELTPVLRESHALASEPAKRSKHGGKPSKTSAKTSKTSAKPSKTSAKPSKTSAKPSKTSTKPSATSAKPSEETVAKPSKARKR